MVMNCKVHTLFLSKLTHLVKAFSYKLPLFISVYGFFTENAYILTLNTVALLRSADNLCTECVKKISVLDESFNCSIVAF